MTRKFCDVCGVELTPENDARTHEQLIPSESIVALTGETDLCKHCAQVGGSINWMEVLMNYWATESTNKLFVRRRED